MRTTLDIEPTALEAVKQLATHRSQSIGAVVSELILKALRAETPAERRNGFPILRGAERPITLEDVKTAEDES